MTVVSPSRITERLAPVGLAELEGSAAALLDRVDCKYVVPTELFAALAARLCGSHRVLEIGGVRAFRYRTTYFDTPGLDAYRDHVQRRRRRYKSRSRRYEDSGVCMFELKLKGPRGRTVKHRMPYEEGLHGSVSPEALVFLRDRLWLAYRRMPGAELGPTLEMAFTRLTLVDVALGERLTCDFDLAFAGAAGRAGRLADGVVILESKSARGGARADRVLRELGARPVEACSKYCLGIGMTRPDVRVNPFRRLLTRWFVPVAATAALAAPAPASAALPVVRIDAAKAIPDGPKLTARMTMPGYRGRIGIETRGQSSQRFPKRSYAIELRDRRGEDRKVPLLGMPADGDWVLYAPYNDKTLMRNVVAYETAAAFGRYAPRTRFVELRLNGRYHGVYVLAERPELGRERVAGDALVELTFPWQARTKGPHFTIRGGRRAVVWNDPERADLSRRRARAIAGRVHAADRALYGPGDWRDHVDEASAIDFALIQELFKNQDALFASTFLALHSDGRLHFGPVWDFDISSGNSASRASGRVPGWLLARRNWSGRMYQSEAFADGMAARWRQLRATGLRAFVLGAIGRADATLHGSVNRNFQRWPVLDRAVWPNPRVRGSYRAEVRHLRLWLTRRIDWIDRNIGRL